MTTGALKPCPFCGCGDIEKSDNGHAEWLRCLQCGCTGPWVEPPEGHDFTGTELEDQWNTRPSPIAEDEGMRRILGEQSKRPRLTPASPTAEPQDSDAAWLLAYHAEQLATYIAEPSISEKNLASARYHNDKIRSIATRLEAPIAEDALVERVASARNAIRYALEAIESGRSEPLFIAKDALRNWIEDDAALQAIERRVRVSASQAARA